MLVEVAVVDTATGRYSVYGPRSFPWFGTHRRGLENVETVLAIELFAAYSALDYREDDPKKTSEIVSMLEAEVPPSKEDRVLQEDLSRIRSVVRSGDVQ